MRVAADAMAQALIDLRYTAALSKLRRARKTLENRKMAASLVGLLDRHRTVLAVIDMPRVEGTLRELARRVKD